jgi:hypothetical protein
MIVLGLVRVIEQRSDELAAGRGIAARTPGNLAAPWRVAAHQDEPRHREALF